MNNIKIDDSIDVDLCACTASNTEYPSEYSL